MAKVEKKYLTPLQKQLAKERWWVRSMHGNVYQMGIPDLLMVRPSDGEIILLEAKGIKEPFLECTQTDILGKLKGPQVGNILVLNKMRSKVCILVGCPSGYYLIKAPFEPHRTENIKTLEEVVQELSAW